MGWLKPETVEDLGFDCEDLDWLETTTVEQLWDLGFDEQGQPLGEDDEGQPIHPLHNPLLDDEGQPIHPFLPEPDPLDTPEPHSDKKIISDMMVETYYLALQFYGNDITKAKKSTGISCLCSNIWEFWL